MDDNDDGDDNDAEVGGKALLVRSQHDKIFSPIISSHTFFSYLPQVLFHSPSFIYSFCHYLLPPYLPSFIPPIHLYYLLTCLLSTYLSTCLPACLFAYLLPSVSQPACLPPSLHASLPFTPPPKVPHLHSSPDTSALIFMTVACCY